MKTFIATVLFILFTIPSVGFANPYEDMLGKSVKDIEAECPSGWLELEAGLMGYDTMACKKFKGFGVFDGQPGIIIVSSDGEVIGAGGLVLEQRPSKMIYAFNATKSLINMDPNCTQLNMAINYDNVLYKCGVNYVSLDIDESLRERVRVVYLKDFKKNFMSKPDKKIDIKDFL